jgi:hypothetical protein
MECMTIVMPIAVGLLVARIVGDARAIAGVVVCAAAIQSYYAVTGIFHHEMTMVSGTVLRAGGTFQDPNALYTVMLFALPLAVVGAVEESRTLPMSGWLVASGMILSALILSWSRGGVIGASCGLAWLLFRAVRRPWPVCCGILVLLAGCAFVLFARGHGVANARSAQGSENSRVTSMRDSLTIFERHPLGGVGVGAIGAPIPIVVDGVATTEIGTFPKNLLLLWMDEMGIVGVAIIGFMAFGFATVTYRNGTLIGAALGAAGIGVMVAGCFDTPIGVSGTAAGNVLAGVLVGAVLLIPAGRMPSESVSAGAKDSECIR